MEQEKDTVLLLRECDAGIKMGISSIDEVLDVIRSQKLKEILCDCKEDHEKLRTKLQKELVNYHDEGKDPNPIAKGMSWMKTNIKLATDTSDATVADLITDGCNMGVKSLGKYLNEYKAADEKAKDMVKELIRIEEGLAVDLRPYL